MHTNNLISKFNLKSLTMKTFLVIILLATFLCSCSKTQTLPQNIDSIPSNKYYPMSLGNYWVYEFVNKDPDGNIIGSSMLDTTRIVSDTLINNYLFYVFELNRPFPNTRFLRRDSLGYIIDQHGEIKLLPSANEALYNFHYGFVGNDTAYYFWEAYVNEISVQSTVGNYDCLARLAYHKMWPIYGGNTTIDSNLYAPIGQVVRSYSYANGSKMLGSLIDYALKQ